MKCIQYYKKHHNGAVARVADDFARDEVAAKKAKFISKSKFKKAMTEFSPALSNAIKA